MWAHGWQGNRKQMGTILLRYQPSVTKEKSWKVLSILLKLWANGSGSEEQCVVMSDLFPNCHRNYTYKFKMFSQWIDCSVARDYHENNKVKDFLAQTFRLSCLSDFKKLPYHEFEWCPRKHLWRNSFFKKVAGLNPATLLRIEFFWVRFSGVFLRIIGRLNSSRLDDLIALTRIMDGFVICWDHGCYSNVGYIQNAFFIRKIFKRKWTSKTQKS